MHTEIETITNPYWFNSISKDNIEKCYQFLDKYYNKDINTSTIKSFSLILSISFTM